MNIKAITQVALGLLALGFSAITAKVIADKYYDTSNIQVVYIAALVLASLENLAMFVTSFFVYDEEDIKIHKVELDNIALRRDNIELQRQLNAANIYTDQLEKNQKSRSSLQHTR